MRRRVFTWIGLWPIVFGMISFGEVEAAFRRLSVEQFNKNYKKWIGLDVQVSGRLGVIGRDRLRFKKCAITFKFTRRLPKLSKDVVNVRVDGELVREGKSVFVRIHNVEERPSDSEQYKSRKSILNRRKESGWYELGEWAKKRSQFYDDKDLLSKSREAFAMGIAIERQAAKGENGSTFLQLASKAERLGLADSLAQSLRHQSYLAMRDSTKGAEELDQIISDVATNLPGSEKPLTKPLTNLHARYETDPLGVYEEADEGRRRILHRMLMSALILERLKSRLDKDFSNGFAVADEIDREIPEFRALAKTYRDKALATRAGQVNTLSRSEVLDLRTKFREQKEPEKGEELVAGWLLARRGRLADDDVEGRLSLAREYSVLLKNKEPSAELLLEAYDLSPKDEETVALLKKLGFQRKNEQWLSPREIDGSPEFEIDRAMREGVVLPRMTADQVIRSLGAPLRITRSASRDRISEIWFFGRPGESRLTVHLSRRAGDQKLRVIATGQAGRR